jgi:hypothetical protein
VESAGLVGEAINGSVAESSAVTSASPTVATTAPAESPFNAQSFAAARRALADEAHALTLAGQFDAARAVLGVAAKLGAPPAPANVIPLRRGG